MLRLSELRNLLLWGGLERETFQALRPAISEENHVTLTVGTAISAAFFALLAAVSPFLSGAVNGNTLLYIGSAAAMLALYFLVRFLGEGHLGFVPWLVFVFELILYGFAAWASLKHPEYPAVSIIVFLVMVPLLFPGRPVDMIGLTVFVAAAFIVLCLRMKEPDIARDDAWNVISFGLVGIAANILMLRIKLRSLRQTREIGYLSVTDLLTGAKNRNCYQNDLPVAAGRCRETLLCVFADVNGLHELNDRKGHEAGDRMLILVAEELIKHFGLEQVYRIGGDEFVVFRPDASQDETEAALDEMRGVFRAQGYYVSFGMAEESAKTVDAEELVRRAETAMYEEKRRYYETVGVDRRHRTDVKLK